MTYEIDISSSDSSVDVDLAILQVAVERGLQTEGVADAVLSVTVVDNATIHKLNREHLQHDYPTDVISFQLEWSCPNAMSESRSQLSSGRSSGASIEGEIVVSAEYAVEMAERCGWSTQNELTLYVIHGMLHICGYDDLSDTEKQIMRSRERAVLEELGLTPQYPDDLPMTAELVDDECPGAIEAAIRSSPQSSLEDRR